MYVTNWFQQKCQVIHWKNDSFSTNDLGTFRYPLKKRISILTSSVHKIELKIEINLNIRAKTIKVLEENTR